MKSAAALFGAVALMCSIASAAPRSRQINDDLGTLQIVSRSDLSASRTATINADQLSGLGLLMLYVEIYDADDGETGVQVSCTAEPSSGGASYRIPACVWDAANTRYNCEAGPMFWNPSDETALDYKRQLFRVDTEGMRNVTCTFAFTTGSASDFITVIGHMATKG